MSMKFAAALAAAGVVVSPAAAQSIAVSIAVRETGSVVALGADGGTNDGIEWVDRDQNQIQLDGTWQQVTFDLETADLLAFAGTTANSMYDTERGVLEHLRFLNNGGITGPLRIFIDDLVITDATGGSFTFDWEAQALGSEHVFQEPNFSGSTNANLLPGGTAAVSDAMSFSGSQSYQLNWQFVDGDPSRWLRLQTFNTPSGGNPTVDFSGTVSFWIKGTVIPAPGGAAVFVIGALAGLRRRR